MNAERGGAGREPAARRTEEGMRRLIAFSDAVIAIAMTLLVLPLTDAAGDAEHTTAWEFLDDHSSLILSVLISFVVIAVFWWHHHELAEYIERYDGPLVVLHFVWLLMIVLLPFSTELGAGHPITGSNVVYLVLLTVAAGSLFAMSAWLRARPDLLVDGEPREQFMATGRNWATLGVMIVALVVAIIWPESGSAAMLILLAIGPVEAVIHRRR
ncbi:MAG: TMEM175 family protein [Gordonia sp. (in: high G+C Gram-positive bacteria)]